MRPVILRLAVCGLVAIGCAGSAMAQVSVLRGSNAYQITTPQFRDWSGFYVGGQVGYPSAGVNFSGGVSSMLAEILRVTTLENEFHPSGWASLPKQNIARRSFGGFFGYNVQFGETIFGIEANYNHTSMRVSSGDTVGRQVLTTDGYINQVTISGTGNVHLTDYGTLRARAGWIYNSLIPYGFAGLAVGRASATKMASVTLYATDADPVEPPVLPDISFAEAESEGKSNTFGYGWTAGFGIDWLVLPNVFLRGEYEYVSFPNFQGVNIAINTFQLAAGLKF